MLVNNNFFKIKSILLVLIWVISSWFLIHILAFLGVFLAIAYPIWWLFFPNQTTCLLCRTKKEGDYCPFCKKTVNNEEKKLPQNLRSAICNGFLILIFSFVSISVVFGENYLLSNSGFYPTPKTASFIIPTKGHYRLGEIFPMKIEIVGLKTPINTVQADLAFNPNKIEVQDVTTDDSFANIFVQKEIDNETGYVRLSGGLPNPGFLDESGIFGTIFFKGKEPGVVKIEYLPTSMVLANDGKGSNVLKDLASVSYLILPERISEEEEEMQKKLLSFNSDVLGENTQNTQMKFYEEEKAVLGTSIARQQTTAIEKEKFNPLTIFLDFLSQTNNFILEQWHKAIDLLNPFD